MPQVCKGLSILTSCLFHTHFLSLPYSLPVSSSPPDASSLSRTCRLLPLQTFVHAVPSARKILPKTLDPFIWVFLSCPTHILARGHFTEDPQDLDSEYWLLSLTSPISGHGLGLCSSQFNVRLLGAILTLLLIFEEKILLNLEVGVVHGDMYIPGAHPVAVITLSWSRSWGLRFWDHRC